EGVGERAARGNREPGVVEIGACTVIGPELFILQRIEDDAGALLAIALERDGDAEVRQAVEKVRRAVELVDDPAMLAILAGNRAALFHKETVARPGAGQFLAQRSLGLVVGIGNEIARSLERDLQLFDFAEIASQA